MDAATLDGYTGYYHDANPRNQFVVAHPVAVGGTHDRCATATRSTRSRSSGRRVTADSGDRVFVPARRRARRQPRVHTRRRWHDGARGHGRLRGAAARAGASSWFACRRCRACSSSASSWWRPSAGSSTAVARGRTDSGRLKLRCCLSARCCSLPVAALAAHADARLGHAERRHARDVPGVARHPRPRRARRGADHRRASAAARAAG